MLASTVFPGFPRPGKPTTSLRSWVEALETRDLARFKEKRPAPEPQLV
jgi:hypothetical protein